MSATKRPTAADRLELIRPDRLTHAQRLFDLTGKCFSGGGYYNWLERCRGYFTDSHYDWDASTIGLIDGEAVTHWGVWDYPMRIGRATVRVGGIGAVCTDGRFRKQGLMAATARAGIKTMARRGYDMTVLFGIGDFYHRFGYVRAWPLTAYTVEVRRLPPGRPEAKVRKGAFKPTKEMDAVYNREHRGLTGTAVRPTYRAGSPPKEIEQFVWSDAKGRLAGYVVLRANRDGLQCLELAGDVETGLQVVAREARRRSEKSVRFPALHHCTEAARYLRRHNCRVEREYIASGGAMIRTLRLRSVLKRIAGELRRRLDASPLKGWTGKLLIADPREKAILDIAPGRVAVTDAKAGKHTLCGGEEIAQLLIGAAEPREILEVSGMRTRGDTRRLVDVLFPEEHPMLRSLDGF